MSDLKDIGIGIYEDVARPAVAEVGAVAGRSVKALLAPIRGFLWGWEQIEQFIESAVQKRLEGRPQEKLKSPDPEIAVPLIQSLSYTAQNDTLREMYVALLANSMDKDKESIVHPSYVDIIKKMNRLDALLFERLSQTSSYQKIVNPRISIKDTSDFFSHALPEWYLGWTIEGYSEMDVSASIVRLSKFGIIELMFDRTITGASYADIKATDYLKNVLNIFQAHNPTTPLEIRATDSVVYVNEYGMLFRQACK